MVKREENLDEVVLLSEKIQKGINKLKEERNTLKEENKNIKEENKNIKEENKKLEKEVSELKQKLSDLTFEMLLRECEIEIEYDVCKKTKKVYTERLKELEIILTEGGIEGKVKKYIDELNSINYSDEGLKKKLKDKETREKLKANIKSKLIKGLIEKDSKLKEYVLDGELLKYCEEEQELKVKKEEDKKEEDKKEGDKKEGLEIVVKDNKEVKVLKEADRDILGYSKGEIKSLSLEEYLKLNPKIPKRYREYSVLFAGVYSKYEMLSEEVGKQGVWGKIKSSIEEDEVLNRELLRYVTDRKTNATVTNIRVWCKEVAKLEDNRKKGELK